MATESEIRAEMSAIERWYREESAENERLKQQIDDLEIALAYVKSAKREAREIEDTFKTYNPDDAWKGRSRERFGSQRYQVYAKAHRYREARGSDLEQDLGSEASGQRDCRSHNRVRQQVERAEQSARRVDGLTRKPAAGLRSEVWERR